MPLRLIHNQLASTPGAILVDDIDDGLPNKEVHRLGSTADPRAYARDGYANAPRQSVYIPRIKLGGSVQGYIDLQQTPRVLLSAGKGKISKLSRAGWITAVVFSPSDIAAPTLSAAAIDTPDTGDVTLTGTKFVSVAPEVTSVTFTGPGAITLTAAQIVAGGGSVTATSIMIPAALVPDVEATNTSVKVSANAQTTSAIALA